MSQQGGYGTVEVRIPILQRTESVIDEYGQGAAGKSQFDAEMRKMEDEMNKLTGQISQGNKRIASRIIQTTKTTTTRTSSAGSANLDNLNQYQHQQQQPQLQYQPQQQQQQQQQSSHTSTSHQTYSTSSDQINNQHQQFPQSDFQTQGGNVIESRKVTTTTHKTVTHSGSGSNLMQGQPQGPAQGAPQPVQWSSPAGAGSNLQQSQSSTQSHYSTQTNQQQPPSVQWSSPAGSSQESRSSHSTTSHNTYTTSGQQQYQQQNQQQLVQQSQFDQQNNQELQSFLGGLNSPLISQGQDGRGLKLRFDVSQYRADEVSVKTVDGKLKIHAKHEEKSDNKSSYREFSKEFSLPIGTNPESIRSSLSKDGILTVEAPFPNQIGQNYLPLTNY